MTTGLFVGSFDPFTIGHESIVRRTVPLFDRLVIGVGINESKNCMMAAAERRDKIAALYAEDDRIEVMTYSGLTADFAQSIGAQYIVKGVRSVRDFESEREQADINRMLTGVETLLLPAEPSVASISSSVVRELMHFGKDVAEFLPKKENTENK